MAKPKNQNVVSVGFKPEIPEGWRAFIEKRFEALYKQAENEPFEFFQLVHKSTGQPARYRLIIGKYGPVWQSLDNRGSFISFENEAAQLAAGYEMRVVKQTARVDVTSNEDLQLCK